MARARQRAHGPRGREREGEDDRDAQEHQQEVLQRHLTGMLPLHPSQVAHRGELNPLGGAPAPQVQHEGDARGGREDERPGGEEGHERRWRRANARRSGTPNGWSVRTGS